MKKMKKIELEKKFKNEKIERKQLNLLHGGDGHGSQGSTDDPWV